MQSFVGVCFRIKRESQSDCPISQNAINLVFGQRVSTGCFAEAFFNEGDLAHRTYTTHRAAPPKGTHGIPEVPISVGKLNVPSPAGVKHFHSREISERQLASDR